MPKNSSALIGSSVVLKCEVVGEEVYPKLRWVKHVNSDVNIGDYSFKAVEYEWLNQPRTCIEIIAYLFDEIPPFVCLNKTDINSTWDINPNYLVLPNVTVEDAGKYTCLAGNSYGITYSSAWLSVIIPSTEVPESHTELTIDSATPSTPATIEMIFGHRTPEVLEEKKTIFQYIVIGACIGFVVTLMLIIIVICCLCRRGRNRRRHAHQNGDAKKKNKNAKHVKVEKKNEKVNDLEMAYQSVNTEDKKDDTSLQNETCLNGVSAKHDTCNGKNEQHRGSVETPDEEEALRSDEKSTTDEDDSDSDSEESDNVSENAESGKNDRSG
ncbi:uncharacterized protein LOC100374705 [Saccoglossus kowalevskii]|uniref:Uncharacterized protein LOC100374705 n=1 Tax=Saccoglossus kowalevskii TaxID=10224 RepID=A0ABM0H0D2_SACKO|nr:PREDICTED: uncharacterized protein LOC100374705 [Saccoglossus kowalevskii]